MNVKPNIGIVNALIRITIGLTLLSWCTAKLVKQPWRDSYLFVALCAAMKVAEGIVRYCPVTDLYEKNWGSSGQVGSNKSDKTDPVMESRDSMEGLTDGAGEMSQG